MAMVKGKSVAKRKFSSFKRADAFKELGIKDLEKWEWEITPLPLSAFFQERLRRLENFGLSGSESAKELLIDAFFEEALEYHQKLRAWKSEPLESDTLIGVADYLIGPRLGYLDTPFVCVAEAKDDKFDQGLAQCLVEMKACQWSNAQAGKTIDIFGIVTNGGTWGFYRLDTGGQVWGSLPYSLSSMESVLGALNYIFAQCESNLAE